MQVSLMMDFLLKNPIGIYFRFSEDTRGTTIADSGLFRSLNNEGVLANFCVEGALLAMRNCPTFSILSIIVGIFCNSSGLASISHKHQRSPPFKNSLALISGFINFCARGSA